MRRLALCALFLMSACGGSSTGGTDSTGPKDAAGNPDLEVRSDAAGKDNLTPPNDQIQEDGVTPCIEGQLGCLSQTIVSVCVNGVQQFSATCLEGTYCLEGQCTKDGACNPGKSAGCDGPNSEWLCNTAGTSSASTPCSQGLICVDGGCKAVECVPKTGQCLTSTSYRTCLDDGSGYGPEQTCSAGDTCVGGRCMSLCEADIKQNTNVGCQYWSVDLDNDPTHHPMFPNQPTPEMFPHSVVIANPGTADATIRFWVMTGCPNGTACAPGINTCNGQPETVCDAPKVQEYELVIEDPVVPAGQSREFKMPVMNLAGSQIARKAIRVMASLPVVAYQFNPFNSENAASNDGSLLLPQNSLGTTYFVVSLPSRGAMMGFPENNGFLTVVATVPNTQVQVTPTVKVIANPAKGVPQDGTTPEYLAAGQTYTFMLQPYDVLNLEQLAEGGIVPPGQFPKDLTGTKVTANQPVAVFSGHQVAGVQEAIKQQMTDVWDSCCTEHLEEQLMPVEAWGTQALCVKSKPRGYEADRFIVVAGEAGVELTTDPPIDGINGKMLTNAGDSLRVETQDSFVLTATGKIQVVQFLMSQGQTQAIGTEPGTGDPSMLILPPSDQYRNEYVIRTADGYGTNWVTVIRPLGLEVLLDGAAIPDSAFVSLGDGTWEYAYRQVDTGNHSLNAAQPFGLMVYGYGGVTAYGYPGGMKVEMAVHQ